MSLFPIPYALCPIPYSLFPTPCSQKARKKVPQTSLIIAINTLYFWF
ncbi:MAG: hypothetical protein F6K56_31160 [Moorea sp. SIO3G5]|nr:hypothetical protein [Moorena sp. SIO3G5]